MSDPKPELERVDRQSVDLQSVDSQTGQVCSVDPLWTMGMGWTWAQTRTSSGPKQGHLAGQPSRAVWLKSKFDAKNCLI